MTRKKWNRLRRQRPELFHRYDISTVSWEKMAPKIKAELVKMSRADAVARLSALILNDYESVNAPAIHGVVDIVDNL